MDKNGNLGQILEQGKSGVTSTVTDVSQSVKNQLIGEESSPDNSTQTQNPNQNLPQSLESPDMTKEVVKDFYAPSQDLPNTASEAQNDSDKLAKVRRDLQEQKQLGYELHKSTYYDPLFAYEQKKPEPTKAQEQEEDKREKMQELAIKQKKKNDDISIQIAQTKTEANPGVMG